STVARAVPRRRRAVFHDAATTSALPAKPRYSVGGPPPLPQGRAGPSNVSSKSMTLGVRPSSYRAERHSKPVGKSRRRHARISSFSGIGKTRSVAAVTMPNVPSVPMKRRFRSRPEVDRGHDLVGRARQDDGGGQLPPLSQGRAAVLAECVRPVPRRNRRAGPDAARPEASAELREIHVHDDRNTGVVFKANDRSCAAQI